MKTPTLPIQTSQPSDASVPGNPPKTRPRGPIALSADQLKDVAGGLPKGGWSANVKPTDTSSK